MLRALHSPIDLVRPPPAPFFRYVHSAHAMPQNKPNSSKSRPWSPFKSKTKSTSPSRSSMSQNTLTKAEYRQLGNSGLRISVPIVRTFRSVPHICHRADCLQFGGMTVGNPKWSVSSSDLSSSIRADRCAYLALDHRGGQGMFRGRECFLSLS